jgi:hypothetical protein
MIGVKRASFVRWTATLLTLFCVTLISGCHAQVFVGNRLAQAGRFSLVYSELTGVQTHEMRLNAGDVIDVEILSDGGRLDISVSYGPGIVLYQGHDADSGCFKLVVREAGIHTFKVSGKKASGRVLFYVN